MTPATASERSAHQWVATLKTPMSTKKTSRGTSPTRAVSATEPPTAVVEGVKEAGAIMGIAVARSAVMSFSGLGGAGVVAGPVDAPIMAPLAVTSRPGRPSQRCG